jgi:hypothetical protein
MNIWPSRLRAATLHLVLAHTTHSAECGSLGQITIALARKPPIDVLNQRPFACLANGSHQHLGLGPQSPITSPRISSASSRSGSFSATFCEVG